MAGSAVLERAVTLGGQRARPLRVGEIVRCVVDAADGPDLQAHVTSFQAAPVGAAAAQRRVL